MEIRKDKYLDLLIHSCGNGLIRVITGMRRCGKSYLLFTLFKNYLIKEGVYIINLMDFLRDPEKYMEERVQNHNILKLVTRWRN